MRFLINNAAVHNVHVSDKTVWRHILVDAGALTGHGEFTVDAPEDVLEREAGAFVDSILGRSVYPELAGEFTGLRASGLVGASLVSALDQAVHDLLAQAHGQTLTAWLGRPGDAAPIPIYANINRRTVDRSPEGFMQSARQALVQGFSAIKIAPFDALQPHLCGTEEGEALAQKAMERIDAVCEEASGKAEVLIDCHWRLSKTAACALLPRLASAGVVWLECPLPETVFGREEITKVRRLANSLGVRLAGCETMTMWEGFRPYVEAGAYDVIMPDVKYVGGFAALHEVIEKAGRHDVAVSLHNPSGPICHMHSLHACAAFGLTEKLEMQFEESPVFDSLTNPPPPPRMGGSSALPTGWGLGTQLSKISEQSGETT